MPRDTSTQERYSLCVGIDKYAAGAGLYSLSCAENDAYSMDQILGTLGFKLENRVLLLGEQATLDAVNEALSTMIYDQAQDNDLVVFYYAGHGEFVTIDEQVERGQREVFLTSYDFDARKIQERRSFRLDHALGMARLRSRFFEGEVGSRKRLFIFDSCHSGAFFGSSYRGGESQLQNSIKTMLESNSVGRVFLASCLPYQEAAESIRDGHGLFTYHLLHALSGEAQGARRSDGTVTVGSLFDYLAGVMPPEQRPVKGGVEQDAFVLAEYASPTALRTVETAEEETPARETRLRAMLTDQQDFVQGRLDRFVGRETEVNELSGRIARKLEEGGYIVITGDAGQGKSSVIAKLIGKNGLEKSAYHFVRFGSGPEHQISILRNLMARLILKYDLPERYVAGESYPILRDYLRRILNDIALKGAREVIFIDGLDQLDTHAASPGDIDISFLPYPLPPGIVVVVGTRRGRTLRALEQLIRMQEEDRYELHGLSREDFEQLLHKRKAKLATPLGDRLYQSLKQNVLYLDLAVRELLAQHDLGPEELIARVASNPDNIFTITFSRMQRLPLWNDVIRPILGVLLVAQEPLTAMQIAHIVKRENVRIREGISHLGELLTLAGKQRYTLFHPKLFAYLQQDTPDNEIQFDVEEVQMLHAQVAHWCEEGTVEQMWQEVHTLVPRDDYREYAQQHYVTHLYEARYDDRLFTILNDGAYEREKLRFDRSTRSTTIDLWRGCQAAARDAGNLERGKELLQHLWRYTLLRTNLTTYADAYPLEAFDALLALGREREAFDLAELLTQPARKLAVLTLLTAYLFKQAARETEGIGLYTRVYEIATALEDNEAKTNALRDLTHALITAQQLVRAKAVAEDLSAGIQAELLYRISAAYAEQHNWSQAAEVAYAISAPNQRVHALSHLAAVLKLSDSAEQAETFWQEATGILSSITEEEQQSKAVSALSTSFTRAKEWRRAETTAQAINSAVEKISALCELANSLMQAGFTLQANAIWEEAQIVASELVEGEKRDRTYSVFARAQIEAGILGKAENMVRRIIDPQEKINVLASLAFQHARKGQWENSKRSITRIVKEYDLIDVEQEKLDTMLIRLSTRLAQEKQWEQAKETARMLPHKEAQGRAFMGIVSELARTGQSEAQPLWKEASILCTAQTDAVQTGVARILIRALVEAGLVEQARQIIQTLPDRGIQQDILHELAVALARRGSVAEAEQLAGEITHPQWKVHILRAIAITQMQNGQGELALTTARSIPHKEKQAQLLEELVMLSCQMQDWQLAHEIAQQIQSSDVQARALSYIIVELVKIGKVTEAEKLVSSIHNEYYKADVLCDLASALARTGAIKRAKRIAHRTKKNPSIYQKALSNISMAGLFSATVSDSESVARDIPAGDERGDALLTVASAYAREHAWEEAEKVTEEIGDERKRDEAWGAIAREYAHVSQWIQAITAFGRIQKSKTRTAVLQAWAPLLAQPENEQVRERIAQYLTLSEEKGVLLVGVANALAQRERYLALIHLTQRAWLAVTSKEQCQYLFAMVQRLLSQNPDMCTHFMHSFRWVDTFLGE